MRCPENLVFISCAGALGRLQGWLSGGAAQRDRRNADLTPAQRELLAASRREGRLDELLGPAPDPPQAPRGQCDAGAGSPRHRVWP